MPLASFAIAANADDAGGFYDGASSWPPSGGGGAWTDSQGSTSQWVSKGKTGALYYSDETFLRWDTSSLPDYIAIRDAWLTIRSISKTVTDAFSVVADYYDFGGGATIAGDWQENLTSIITPVTLASLTANVVNTFVLTDFSGISVSGFTGIRLGLSSGTPTGDNAYEFAQKENGVEVATLFVVYSLLNPIPTGPPRPPFRSVIPA
jgi:hypothetical protein